MQNDLVKAHHTTFLMYARDMECITTAVPLPILKIMGTWLQEDMFYTYRNRLTRLPR